MASPSPITDGKHVYSFFGSGDVFCLDLEGRLVWQRSLAAEYGAFENRFAASSSPLLFEDMLIVQCDHYGSSYLLAIDKLTGANRWKTDRPEAWLSWSSPVLVPIRELSGRRGQSHFAPRAPQNRDSPRQFSDRLVVAGDASSTFELVVCGSEKMDAFDPLNGRKLWTLSGMARECIPTPVVGRGLIYATSGPNGSTFAVRPGGQGDVTGTHVVWSNNRGNPFVPSAILVGDYYYLVDDHGIGTCLDAGSGKVIWKKRFGGDFTASPVAAEGRVYFTNEAGSTLVIRADSPKYQELAQNSIDEPVFASAAISHGQFFLRGARQLWCIGGHKAKDTSGAVSKSAR